MMNMMKSALKTLPMAYVLLFLIFGLVRIVGIHLGLLFPIRLPEYFFLPLIVLPIWFLYDLCRRGRKAR